MLFEFLVHPVFYTVLSRRSFARIIMSKCPAQSTTMFPRRRNILFAVSKSATVFCLFYSLLLAYHIYTLNFVYDDKEQRTIGLTVFARRAKKKTCYVNSYDHRGRRR